MREIVFNPELIISQKVTDEQIKNLRKLHQDKDDLLEVANSDINFPVNAEAYVSELRDIEFEMQDNWNFERDALKHTYWNHFKDCTCPVLDNLERFGHNKWVTGSCPYHGKESHE